jgi:hypothetical protein
MAETEQKPFWMDEEEWEKRYPKMPQENIAEQVVNAVPELHPVEKGEVVGAYTTKDGLLIYHFYKRDRKKIYDEAHAEMDRIRDEEPPAEVSRLQQAVATGANVDLDAHPWWPEMSQVLDEVFTEHFKHRPKKITFYPEPDAWSVIMPEPDGPVSMGTSQLEAPFAAVALKVGG